MRNWATIKPFFLWMKIQKAVHAGSNCSLLQRLGEAMEDSPVDTQMFRAVPVRDTRQGVDPAVAALLALPRIGAVCDADVAGFVSEGRR